MNVATDSTARRGMLRAEAQRALADLLSRSAAAAHRHGPQFQRLWGLIGEHAQGGKLVRPLLLMEIYDALRAHEATPTCPEERAEAVRIAAAVEALHFAFLLHDDVIDGDLLRRGRQNLIGELVADAPISADAHHWAQAGGILAGDLMLSAAHQIFARANVGARSRIRLLDLLDETITETTAGELADVGLGDGVIDADLPTVLDMTRGKTAAYTFQLPLRAAAVLAGVPVALETALGDAGLHLGSAYQLHDDLLSTFGDATQHGKDPISDIREGKQTALICFARMTSAWPLIRPHFGDPELTPDAAAQVRRLLTECGAERFVRGLIDEERAAFASTVDEKGAGVIPASVRAVLHEVAAELDGRCV